MKTSKTITLYFFLLIAFLFTSCASTKTSAKNKLVKFKNNYCAPVVPYETAHTLWKEPVTSDLSTLNLSLHDQLLCKILGITNNIHHLAAISKDSSQLAFINGVYLKQKIINKIMLAQSQLQSVIAELDCEGERADMASNYIDGVNSKRNTRLTIASVIVGALTTVVTAAISDTKTQVGVGVSGGLLSAGLGVLTINPKGKKIEYYHERNLLSPIWTNTEINTAYPDFVWQMLHEKSFSNKGELTLAESIKSRWLQFDFEGSITKEQEALLFGAGGFYHADELHSRAAMINQLQATVRSFYQDLNTLITYINSLEKQ